MVGLKHSEIKKFFFSLIYYTLELLFLAGQKDPVKNQYLTPPAIYLSHKLHESEGSLEHDAEVMRALLIGNSLEIRETFRLNGPVEILSALEMTFSSSY